MSKHKLEEFVDEWVEELGDEVIISTEVQSFLAWIFVNHPGVVEDWLRERRDEFLHRAFSDALSRRRSRVQRRGRKNVVFSQHAAAFQAGDLSAEEFITNVGSPLDAFYEVDSDNRRKRLREMTVEDLNWTIDSYDKRAKANAFEAIYLTKLRDKMGVTDKVGEVFSDVDALTLRQDLTE